jgi:hypothetical protein
MLLISRLQMPLKKKNERFGHLRNMFIASCRQHILMGGIPTFLSGCVVSIIHLVTSVRASHSMDKSYTLFPLALWT